MNALDRARKLRDEAEIILKMIHLEELVKPFGAITPHGSYLLDVMAYPDIDVYIPKLTIKEIFNLGAAIAEVDEVIHVIFEKSDDPGLPGAYYLKPRIAYGDWGRPWKVDIWSVNKTTLKAKVKVMDDFRQKITPELRKKIIEYKHSIMTNGYRTPMSSGYYIYRAFLDEGLVDFPDVTDYLIAHGIKF